MALTEKLRKLVDTLVSRTKEGRANWSPGSRDDTFLWSTPSGSVVVFPEDHDDQPPWTVRILGSEGQILEQESFSINDNGFKAVDELYALARANALDIDSTIDALLEDLG
ncbi:hypothetical protein [Arthrobacter koreensis]|uniref:hypothetical protein n=1 Tax=Arthrobacter koreensis TaxID=199136 RepID=UPI0036D8BBEF